MLSRGSSVALNRLSGTNLNFDALDYSFHLDSWLRQADRAFCSSKSSSNFLETMMLSLTGHGKSFRESVKGLEADIQHANMLAASFPRDYGGACLQMRLAYSPVAPFFLFLVQWADCSFAGALGLMRILLYKVASDGSTTMSLHERRASLHQFYGTLYPSLQQLHGGLSEYEEAKQRSHCKAHFSSSSSYCSSSSSALGPELSQLSSYERELAAECGICMEDSPMVALPGCIHAMCFKCYQEWCQRSQSCPFCRDSLKRVDSKDLWFFTETADEVADLATLRKDNLRRLFLFIEKLPIIVTESVYNMYESVSCKF